MSIYVHDRPILRCSECDGTGTVSEYVCPVGCPAEHSPEGCHHRKVRTDHVCEAPHCWLGFLECPEDGGAAVGYGKDGRPACFDCLHEEWGEPAEDVPPPASVEGLRQAS